MSDSSFRAVIFSLVAIAALVLYSANQEEPPPRRVFVSAHELGEERWPLTVPRGWLECVPPYAVTFETKEGDVYAVNGIAVSAKNPDGTKRYWDIDPIWKENPDPRVPKVNLGPLIETGNAMCDRLLDHH